MTKKEIEKEQLEEQLEKVNQRIQVLDLMEEKLFKMRELAQKVIDKDLNDEEIHQINKQVKHLEEQVMLLDRKSTQLS